MRDLSIRLRILAGVTLVMFLSGALVVVYLHQSYSTGLDVTAQQVASESVAAWEVLVGVADDEFGKVGVNDTVVEYLFALQDVTGADYGLLLSKDGMDEDSYAAARDAIDLGNNWDEREDYVLVATTDDVLAERMQFNPAPADVPEIGKVIGIENGACTRTCHGGIEAEGDYWVVAWSKDRVSYSHGVFPVVDSSGQPIGVIYAIKDISRAADAAKESMLRTIWFFLGSLLVGTLVIGGMLDTLVFKRLGRMIVTMEELSIQVAGGAFDVTFEPEDRKDELGQFEAFFARFLAVVSSAFKHMGDKR